MHFLCGAVSQISVLSVLCTACSSTVSTKCQRCGMFIVWQGSQLWHLVKAHSRGRDDARDVTRPPCAHLWYLLTTI
ncbi:uncharacterized protein BJ212DRAFT_1062255 [Suillus subaureus]|uniref:Secreted protein n=1 Tax=Suillus subaureus TaxID=48587 RepID=A0A9P7EEQ1_9AGAM|nr:uncharacterized protein BJ212DRAFT_1062255 [Suillus subaureus]KAG1819708.1 hypothetical protein BJ212DRAFT_1062255 [Suillus subaureus]